MQQRISVNLNSDEVKALLQMAHSECRHPRDQIRFVLRKALEKAGYLSKPKVTAPPRESKQ